MSLPSETVEVLELRLHGWRVGYLAGYQGGRNVLVFAREFAESEQRPTLTLTTQAGFPKAPELLARPWLRQQRLHPVLANLLPEGAFREWLAQGLKVHPDNEFLLLAQLGRDLPGALEALPMAPEEVPDEVLSRRTHIASVKRRVAVGRGFSLAGVQMKFSMRQRDGRFYLGHANTEASTEADMLGDWIIKTPSTRHSAVPANEYTAMTLAGMAGVEIPDIRLVSLSDLEGLPSISLPAEELAYAIRRFDRDEGQRIHSEDMAQVLFRYPHDKYSAGNYEQLGRLVHRYTRDGLADLQQFARRLLVNLLLAKGDAHLKNWSLLYPDGVTPRLAPAYDILTTRAYIDDERHCALNLNGQKNWYHTTFDDLTAWAKAVGVPWRAIELPLRDTLERARTLWPAYLNQSPMAPEHQRILIEHWRSLAKDFRIS